MENSRINNFDFLRILFASLVIVSHSYLATGNRNNELLSVLTNRQEAFGSLAVKCFFIISGYLIFQSLNRSKTIFNYFWKRLLRIYPGYFIMLIFTSLLIPFVYNKDVSLFKNPDYFNYFLRQLTIYHTQDEISGVFSNQPSHLINGSLWTIKYEITMYFLLGILFLVKKKWRIYFIFFAFLSSYLLLITNNAFFLNNRLLSKIYLQGPQFYDLLCLFMGGALCTSFSIKNNLSSHLIVSSAFIIIIISFYLNIWSYLKYLLLPIIIVFWGSLSIPYISSIGKKVGDISYGIYIYGWLIQQTLYYYFHFSILWLTIFSLLLAFIFGFISWHLVEKKALSYKNLIA